MIKISIKLIELDWENYLISIDGERMNVSEVTIAYMDSGLFSYLVLITSERVYLVKRLKSFWNLTHEPWDWMEKAEDNKVFSLYWDILYLKEKNS